MYRRAIKFSLCAILLFAGRGLAQQNAEYSIKEIIVSASRNPVEFSSLSRSVVLITPREIDYSPVSSVNDLLKNVPGVDLRTRGVGGVQADIGIRGGTFEQTLVLIDGIKLNDAQTGHHNLNLPVPLNMVERIEILKGQGARVFGANAFSGAVNIITRKEKGFSLTGQLTGGENGLFGASLFNSHSIGNYTASLSFSKDKSDGYRHNTGYDIISLMYNSAISLGKGQIGFIAGYNDKKFGANNFYSDKYPNQWEHTTTRLAAVTGNFDLGLLILTPKFYWRGNDDDYVLDNTRPDWYRNRHKTNSFTGEIQAGFTTPLGNTAIGAELSSDKIESSNLGNHERSKGGFFAEQSGSPFNNFNISLGFFAYNYSDFGWKFWPGIDASYLIDGRTKIFASAGKAFRIPTYTELYYKSPAQMGNPSLMHEETINYEAGISYSSFEYQITGSIFYKEGKNIIDWVRGSANDVWTVRNETNLNTTGFEAGVIIFPQSIISWMPIVSFGVNYTYLSLDRSTSGYQSRYSLDHLRHQLIITAANNLPWDIKQNWTLRYENRESYEDNFIVDAQVIKEFKHFSAAVKASNLFNSPAMDLGGIPLPGRWISASVKLYY